MSDKSARILVHVLLVDDPRAEVGGNVRVGVGPIEFQLYRARTGVFVGMLLLTLSNEQ